MACLTSSYQLLCLQLLLLFYSITSTPLCLLQESSALLQFKHLFSFTNESSSDCIYSDVPSYPKMMSWKEANDCCSWDGVTCDTVTGHVIGLDLSCSWLHGNIPSNTSLFLLYHLQTLNLAFNDFNFSKISSDFSRLSSLTLLNLSYSSFEGQIPSEISHLSKLVLLDLSQHPTVNSYPYEIVNSLLLETPVLEGLVQNLTQLRELALDYVNMSTVIPSSLLNLSSSLTSLSLQGCDMQGNFLEHIFNLPNLRELALDYVNMSTVIPSSLSNLSSSLTSLSLRDCGMHRNFPEHIFNLPNLRELALDYVNMSTVIPSSLSNLSSSLTSLSLRGCGMQGNFPEHVFNLPNLQVLDLYWNINLTVNFPKVNWSSPLNHLDVSSTNLSRALPDSISNLKSLRYLSLSYCKLFGSIPSSLVNLTQLTYLDLSSNSFVGSIPAYLANLTQLTYLDLSSNSFVGSIPASLASLTQLTNLYLSYNSFNSTIPIVFVNLTQLTYLDLSSNSFVGSIPASLANLTQLTYLDLSSNSFVGSIPAPLASLTQLTNLDLSYNSFNSTIPIVFVNLTQLTYLYLSSNSFVGSIPASLANLTQLTDLDLSYNGFNGTIPDVFVNLTQLSYLYLGGNQLGGPIPSLLIELQCLVYIDFYNNSFSGTIPSWLFTLPSLEYLDLSFNNLSGSPELYMFAKLKNLGGLYLSHNKLSVHTTFKANSSLPQLSSLGLSACNISEFPDILKSSTQLYSLDLSENKIQGQIPNWMWDIGRDTLGDLNLSHNFLTGVEQQLPWKNLRYLDLRSNLLQGSIPNPPPYLWYFLLSNNKLIGTIPHVICNLSVIEILDLSNNSLTSNIPKCIGNISNTLRVLDLHKNRLNGSIPKIFAKGNHLKTLNLNDNELEGRVLRSLENCTMLEVLDIGNNNINDTFPYWLGNLPQLRVLVLRSNKFYGAVWNVSKASHRSFTKMRILDLSNNNFSGSLPVSYFENMHAMMNVDKAEKGLHYMGESYYQDSVTVTLKGFEIVLEKIITIFTTIDLSNNNFHGEIPEMVGKFQALRLLNLSHNYLTGRIPSSIGNLAALESLDLSSNKLVGKIPWQLSSLNFLQFLNLSENQLWGAIPRDNHLDTFSATSYGGNKRLCGFPLPNNCGVDESQQPLSKLEDDKKSRDGFGWKSVLIGYGCGVAFGFSMGYLIFSIEKPRWVVESVAYWIIQIWGINILAKKGRRLNK